MKHRERLARAIYEALYADLPGNPTWEELHQSNHDRFRRAAKAVAALTAEFGACVNWCPMCSTAAGENPCPECLSDGSPCGFCGAAALAALPQPDAVHFSASSTAANPGVLDAMRAASGSGTSGPTNPTRDYLLRELAMVGIHPPENEGEPWIVTTDEPEPCEGGMELNDAIRQTARILTSGSGTSEHEYEPRDCGGACIVCGGGQSAHGVRLLRNGATR